METLKKFGLGLFLAIIIISTGNTNQAAAQARVGISFQTFYDELEPYGRWIRDRQYGYVWSPRVSRGFQPYATNGRWIVTEYGNTWLSDYPWGWAPFHYGRWTFDDFYGWIWIPDYEWGPAWVSWRHGGGYYGWAPIPPGVSIHVSINIPASRWIFVPQRYITSPRIYNYYAPRTRVVNIYNHTTIINNYYDRDNRHYVYGPRRSDIERATRSKVSVHRINDAERPGRPEVRSGSVSIYRPQTSANSRSETARPSRSTESTYSRNERSSTPSERNTASERVSSERNNTPQNNNTVRERPSRSESPRYSEPSNRNSGSQGKVSSESRPEPQQPQTQRSSRPQRSQPAEVRRETPRTQSTSQGRGNSQGNSSSSSRESSGRPSRR